MNRGLKSYGIFLVMITTLVFTLTDFGVVNATTSADQNPSTQSSGLPELNHDSGDKNRCDDCNNNNDNNNDNNDNSDDGSSSSNANNNNDNDDSSTSSSSSSSSSSNANNNNDNNGKESTNSGDVPMSLPFNSNVGGQSDDSEKDYSSVIPFP